MEPVLVQEGRQQTTIVVAEDETPLRMIATEFLTEAGFTVIEAMHAEHAISIFEVQFRDIQVLFTDINMPGDMNGLGLAHHVRSNWPWINVLVTSGDAAPTPEELPEGSRFLAKPYVHDEVVGHVQSMIAA